MRFAVLGPLEVRSDTGKLIDIRRPRQRTLLAVLAMRANEYLPVDWLVGALWGENPPRTAAGVLRTYVWALRRESGLAELIETRPSGYRLTAAPSQLDVHQFYEFSEQGRLAGDRGDAVQAESCYRQALTLWRAPELRDLVATPLLTAKIAELYGQRRAARDGWVEARLALGHHDDLAGYLRGVLDEDPLNERVWSQLMLALYRGGRQSEALAAYAEVRQQLVEEYGLSPGAELQRLQRAVLTADPRLDLPAAGSGTSGRNRESAAHTADRRTMTAAQFCPHCREEILISVLPVVAVGVLVD